MDLPNAASQRPPVHPTLKTALQRSEKDELRSSDLASLSLEFGRVIRELDSERMIITGNAAPRQSAWHNSHEHSWKADTRDQFQEVLLRDNPEPIDTLSIHLYPEKNYPGGVQDAEAFLKICMDAAKAVGKKIFVGEFGIPRSQNVEGSRTDFEKMLAALVKWKVPLAALWVYDFPNQEKDWNVTFENDRAFMLEMIGKANVELAGARKS